MKKAIVVLLVFSLPWLSGTLYAEKKGSEIVIHKMDGKELKGELIAVKKYSLLLMEEESGADVNVQVGEIKKLKVVKNSKIIEAAGIGTLVGGGIAASLTYLFSNIISVGLIHYDPESRYILKHALVGSGIGFAIGSLSGAIQGKDETILIIGKTDSEIKRILDALRKKARGTNFQ